MKRFQAICAILVSLTLGFVAATSISGCGQPASPVTTRSSNVTTVDAGSTETQDQATPAEPALDDASPAEAATGEQEPAPASSAAPEPANEPAPAEESADASAAAPADSESVQIAAVDTSANAQLKPGDWSQWGGSSFRNNTPLGGPPPMEWDIGSFDRRTGDWNKEEAVNIKWVAQLGSQSYGNAVVAQGKIYAGTNNSAGHLKRYPPEIDLGCLLCFNESDGSLLWQHSSEKLPTGRVHDWPLQGICCAPYAEGDRLWFVTSRGEVICLDAEGYHDGEDDGEEKAGYDRLFDLARADDPEADEVAPAIEALGKGELTDALREMFAERGMPLADEVTINAEEPGKKWALTAMVGESERQFRLALAGPNLSAFKLTTVEDKLEADEIWVFDMMNELGVSQHNMCSCSVTALGDILFVNTSNGLDETHINLPAPDAPSFMAMNKNTGEVYWTDKSPGLNILHGQWSSPTVAVLGGVPQVIFGGGDGWVYSFRADEGQGGKPELLWRLDGNPKTSKWVLGGAGTRNNIIATPVVYDGLVYVAMGQDPEHGEGVGHLWCIDPTKRGDVSPELAVNVQDRTTPIPHKRIQAVIEEQGEVAIDNPNSAVVWHYSEGDANGDGEIDDFEEKMHRSCGTVAIKNDLLFISDFSGLFHCLDAKTGKPHWTYDMLAQAWGSPLILEDKVYIGDEDGDVCIFNLSPEKHEPLVETNMGSSVYSTPIYANGVLYISSKDRLFAITAGEEGQ